MRPPPRVVRRVVVDPLFLLLAVPLSVVLALLVAVGTLLAPLAPRRRVQRVARFALAYLRLDVGLVLTGALLWLRRPLHGGARGRRRWTEEHCRVLRRALVGLLAAAEETVGFRLELDPGTPLPARDGRPLVVLARHAGPGDSFSLVWLLLDRLGRTPRVVLKDVLLWDPGLDVVLTRLAGCFLSSRSGAGDDNADRVAALARDLGPDDALLLFPEGGNWTPGRQRRAVRRLGRAGHRRAARKGAARPALLPPRPTGTAAVLEARPDADVLVVAHGGLDSLAAPRAVWRAVPFDGTPMRVHWWPVPSEEVPHRADDVPGWLDGQWDRIADWLSRPGRAGRRG